MSSPVRAARCGHAGSRVPGAPQLRGTVHMSVRLGQGPSTHPHTHSRSHSHAHTRHTGVDLQIPAPVHPHTNPRPPCHAHPLTPVHTHVCLHASRKSTSGSARCGPAAAPPHTQAPRAAGPPQPGPRMALVVPFGPLAWAWKTPAMTSAGSHHCTGQKEPHNALFSSPECATKAVLELLALCADSAKNTVFL